MTDARFTQAAQTWNDRYTKPAFLFGTRPNAYLVGKQALLQSGKTALAVADGKGRNSVWLAQQEHSGMSALIGMVGRK